MVISSTTQHNTAKTLSTLAHNLNLTQYENIIILDDDADDIWCKHEMYELKKKHKVNVILIEVPVLDIWKDIYRRFLKLSITTKRHQLSSQRGSNTSLLYKLIADYHQKDKFFLEFYNFLELLHRGGVKDKFVMTQFAALMPDESGFNQMTNMIWRWFT